MKTRMLRMRSVQAFTACLFAVSLILCLTWLLARAEPAQSPDAGPTAPARPSRIVSAARWDGAGPKHFHRPDIPAGSMSAPGMHSAATLGEPGLSFRYVRTFGQTEVPYFEDADHLNGPTGVGTDGTNVWIVECDGYRALKYASDGTFLMQIGKAGLPDATGTNLWCLQDVAIDRGGNIWLVSAAHYVAKLDSSGSRVGELGVTWESGTDNDHFNDPRSIAFDSAGNIYVSDSGNHRIQVFDNEGTYITSIGESGVAGSDDTHFNNPRRISVDSSNLLNVADGDNHRVQIFDVSDASAITYVATIGVSGEAGSDNAHLDFPQGVAVDVARGRIYVADGNNWRVQVFDYTTRGYLSTLTVSFVEDVAVDSTGNLYVAESWSDRNQVQQFNSNLEYVRTYGTTGVPYLTDGSHYNGPTGLAVAPDGSIYIGEENGRAHVGLGVKALAGKG